MNTSPATFTLYAWREAIARYLPGAAGALSTSADWERDRKGAHAPIQPGARVHRIATPDDALDNTPHGETIRKPEPLNPQREAARVRRARALAKWMRSVHA